MKYLYFLRKNLLYLTLLIPLLYTPFTAFAPHFGKTMIFQILVGLCLALVLVGVLIDENKTSLKKMPWWHNKLDVAVVLFIGLLVVTSLLGNNPALSFWGDQARANGALTWIHFGIWYFLLKKTWTSLEWKRALLISIVVLFLIILTAFFQKSLPAGWGLGGEKRLQGILGNPNFLSMYLVPAIALPLLAGVTAWKGKATNFWKIALCGMGVVALCITLVFTQSRGSVIGFGFGIIAAVVAALLLAAKKKTKIIAGLSLSGIIIMGAVLVVVARTPWMIINLPSISHFFNVSNFTAGTGETRLWAWQIALQGIKEHPLLGSGIGSYEAVFSKYYNPGFLKHSFSETVWDKPHNWFLEIAGSAGIVGLAAYLGIYAAALWYVLKKPSFIFSDATDSEKSIQTRAASIIFTGVLVAYGVQQIFLFETNNSLLLFFFLLAAISSGVDGNRVGEGVVVPRGLWYQKIAAGFGVLVLVSVLYKGSLLPLKASYHLKNAQKTFTPSEWARESRAALAVPVAFRAETGVFLAERFVLLDKSGVPIAQAAEDDAVAVANVLHDEGVAHPLTIAYPAWAGQIYSVLGTEGKVEYLDQAETELKRAVEISPRKQDILFLLGRLYLLKKDFAQAIKVQQAALAADPSNPTSHWFLGLTYQAADKHAEAIVEIQEARRLGLYLPPDQKMYVIDIFTVAKEYSAAAELYQEFIAAEPENPNWYVRLAALYALAGNKKGALEYAERAVAIEPSLREEADDFIKENNLR